MQEIVPVPNSAFHLKRRNETANAVIEKYAKHYHLMNFGSSMTGLFIPKDSIQATLAPIAVQAPLICQPLAKELSYIYSATPEMITQGLVTDAITIETTYDLKNEFIIEFGPEFILELLLGIWLESGVEAVAGLLPVIGEVIVTTLDVTFTTTLTWQIGIMTAMYFMNDEKWVTSKQETRRRARKQLGLPSPNARRPGVLKNIPQKNPEIQEKIIRGVEQIIRLMKESNPAITPAQIHSLLKEKGIDDEFIETEGL
jgi:hypothetical protein